MAKAFHNLAGLCRDLRAAALAAAEGNQEAIDICVAFDDAMELHDALLSGDMADGEDSDASASGDDAEDESEPLPRGTRGRSERVGAEREAPAQHSTRARSIRDRRRTASVERIATPSGVARRCDGGKR